MPLLTVESRQRCGCAEGWIIITIIDLIQTATQSCLARWCHRGKSAIPMMRESLWWLKRQGPCLKADHILGMNKSARMGERQKTHQGHVPHAVDAGKCTHTSFWTLAPWKHTAKVSEISSVPSSVPGIMSERASNTSHWTPLPQHFFIPVPPTKRWWFYNLTPASPRDPLIWKVWVTWCI